MKEFLLLIRTQGSVWTSLPPEKLQEHLQNGSKYIGNLMKEGKLKSAAPVDNVSRLVDETNGTLRDGPFNETKEVIAGYFLVEAKNIEEAVNVAKGNPIFRDISTKIEVHQLKPIGG